MEKMKKFKRRLSQTLRGSHTIDESLSELAEQMTIEENGLKDSGEVQEQFVEASYVVGGVFSTFLFYGLNNTGISWVMQQLCMLRVLPFSISVIWENSCSNCYTTTRHH